MNEMEETKVENIRLDREFVILEKMDGSMISPFHTGGRLRQCEGLLLIDNQCRYATKNGVTDTALVVEEFVARSNIKYNEFCGTHCRGFYFEFIPEEWIAVGWSPIFEWCSPKSPIVLHYPQDSLSLIALRNVVTGEYYPFK